MEGHRESRRLIVESFGRKGLALEAAALDYLLNKGNYDLGELVEEVANRAGGSTLFITKAILEEALLGSGHAEQMAVPADVSVGAIYAPQAASIKDDVKVLLNVEELDRPSDDVESKRAYLADRFRKLEKVLRSRLDVSGVHTIPEASKLPDKSRAKIIAMILDVRSESFMLLEDLHGSAYLIIPRKASEQLRKKAQRLHQDLVACFEVVVLGGKLICSDIILPDIPEAKPNRASEEICAVLTSDLHVGSAYFMDAAFQLFLKWLRGEVGGDESRRLAGKVKYVVIAGDLVDGVGIYPQQEKEISIKNVRDQYKRAAELLRQIPDHIHIVIIPGNHDATRKALPQPPIPEEYGRPLREMENVSLLSNPSLVALHGVKFLITHGTSLEDLANRVPEFHYSHADVAMSHLLAVRHVAPIYGGRTPIHTDGEDMLVISERPDVFHAGHIHSYKVGKYRGVVVANTGTWQMMTPYQQSLGYVPAPGIFTVLHLDSLNVESIPIIAEAWQ